MESESFSPGKSSPTRPPMSDEYPQESVASAAAQSQPSEGSSVRGGGGGSTSSNKAGSMNWEPIRSRLLGDDLKDALAAAQGLREQMEVVHTTEYPLMLSALLPAFSTILTKMTPNPDPASTEHKLRNTVLEIMSRMPSNEVLRPHAPHLVAVALDILNRDYEDNALLACSIIFVLYKQYRSLSQEYVQPYLDFVSSAYRSLPGAVNRRLSFQALMAGSLAEKSKDLARLDAPSMEEEEKNPAALTKESAGGSSDTVSTHEPDDNYKPNATTNTDSSMTKGNEMSLAKEASLAATKALELSSAEALALSLSPRSNASFRVLTECPLIVMLLFQLYPRFLRSNISGLIKVMMEALSLRAPKIQVIEQDDQSLDDASRRLYNSRCRELAAAQAKTLSFLTYLLRGFSHDLKPYEDRLATNVVALMSSCPRELVSTRKELLVATRHLLNSDFRKGFYSHVDSLLDEKLLMGSYHRHSEQSMLRPLGYAVLSDFVLHVKAMLALPQISKVVSIFSRLTHDSSLPMSTQYTSVKALLSVVDTIYHNRERDPQIGRDILVRILRTLVEKLSLMHANRVLLQEGTAMRSHRLSSEDTDAAEPSRENKSIIRAIVVGLKTLVWHLNNYGQYREKEKIENVINRIDANVEVFPGVSKITHTERAMIHKYIHLAFPSISVFKAGSPDDLDQYRDTLSYFASTFTTFDGADLRKVWGQRLGLIVDAISDDPTAIIMPRHLLNANPSTSFEFSSMMLHYLVPRMDNLAVAIEGNVEFLSLSAENETSSDGRLKDTNDEFARKTKLARDKDKAKMAATAAAHLQLFERILRSLSSYPENERALRLHLKQIVSTCVRSATEKSDFRTDNYCMLLRYMFRSISAGKFEESYRELLSLIPTVLNGFFRVVSNTDDVVIRHNLMELTLTIPARLSSLLPHMNLLLKIIVMALQSQTEELTNLGLRTLEFWVDNLNPDFLFPNLSRQNDVFVDLMKALSTHLRPAPYPYGLLTLRLLGKIGGKNRAVLREPMDVTDPALISSCAEKMAFDFGWSDEFVSLGGGADSMVGSTANIAVDLPIDRCVEYLREAALSQRSQDTAELDDETQRDYFGWKESGKLSETDFEKIDLLPYCLNVIEDTTRRQVDASIQVLRTALTQVMGAIDQGLDKVDLNEGPCNVKQDQESPSRPGFDMQSHSARMDNYGSELRLISLGLMFGCSLHAEEQLFFVKGMLTRIYISLVSNQRSVVRIDANGSSMDSISVSQDEADPLPESGGHEGGSLKTFGYFELGGPLKNTTNPLSVNGALADFLSHPILSSEGLELLEHVLSLSATLGGKNGGDESATIELERGPSIFYESLLYALCDRCLSVNWDKRNALYSAICLVIKKFGSSWGKRYETELMNVALFSLKSIPKEVSIACARSFEFLIHVCARLYGKVTVPLVDGESANSFVVDILSPLRKKRPLETLEELPDSTSSSGAIPSDEVLQMLIPELASIFSLSRAGARFVLEQYILAPLERSEAKAMLEKSITLIRRVIFSRSLRILPLQEKVGAIEALAVLVDSVPELIPIDDQHLLAFLSELLKMASIADGEMADTNASNSSVVDKDGFVLQVQDVSKSREIRVLEPTVRSSSLFLRRDCIVLSDGIKFLLGEELPPGVQFRVSAITLLRSVIRGHPDAFFDAESSTPVGNIRPHVVSLLFRSLVSQPKQAVVAAHDSLRDVLTLSVVTTEDDDGSKSSKSRLRKELLQTCIRPVLLNLRDYTRLSTHLVLGLSQLLSLLSSWFNKTLGEKLLDHLQKWTDPNRIRAQKIWREGEEPDVAASIVGLFHLLPHASHFVEALVKTTIKLEACLPAYKSQSFFSPYRKPLALYLNKYSSHTISFFFPRLKTPFYTELFMDIVQFQESKQLREYLSRRQSSNSLLNIAFERPLNVVRSEKNSAGVGMPTKSPKGDEFLALHGIKPFPGPKNQKQAALLRDVEAKQKKVRILQQELSKARDALQARATTAQVTAPTAESKVALELAKKQHKIAKTAYERGSRECEESKKRYSSELAQFNVQAASPNEQVDSKPMDVTALEWQLQGFTLIHTLVAYDEKYLKDHTDVLRAFRWLWRSKGRYLRMQHDESISPRFHGESKSLALFLVSYSSSAPNDVDLLFELSRIFLQPTTSDFSFVRDFLDRRTASMDPEQRDQIIQRFFALMAGDNTEEIKVLSLEFVVYPMFRSLFRKTSKVILDEKRVSREQGEGKQGKPKDAETHHADDEEVKIEPHSLDPSIVQKFVSEILFSNGSIIKCGDRLNVALLRLCNLILEHAPALIGSSSDDLMKFYQSLSTSEDMACKAWSYLAICRLIHSFETEKAVVLKVYMTLVHAHQSEGKNIIKQALDLLVPTLSEKLDGAGLKNAIDTTCRIMFEETNSIPQLAHIWQIIVDNPTLFYHRRAALSRFMVTTLPRMALPPNSPAENRSLAVAVVKLVLQWEKESQPNTKEDEMNEGGNEDDQVDIELPSSQKSLDGEEQLRIDRGMVDAMVNFLIRLQILLADRKGDAAAGLVQSRVETLLNEIIVRWNGSEIRPVFFEKVVAMCADDDDSEFVRSKAGISKRPQRGIANVAAASGTKEDDFKRLSQGLPDILSACLDVFTILATKDPQNPFLFHNPTQLNSVLSASLRYSKVPSEEKLREKLRRFLAAYLNLIRRRSSFPDIVVMPIRVWIDRLLLDATVHYIRSPGVDSSSRGSRTRQQSSGGPKFEECASLFVLDVIKEVGSRHPSFRTLFTKSLLGLLDAIMQRHLSAASARQKQEGVTYTPPEGTVSIRQMYQTRIAGILLESASESNTSSIAGKNPQRVKSFPLKELAEFDDSLQAAVAILGILGNIDLLSLYTHDRKLFLSLLQSILDASSSVQLLLATVQIVGGWLLRGNKSGLTTKERNNLLWKIASFDFNSLSDVVSQPLVDLVGHYVIELIRRSPSVGAENKCGVEVTLSRSIQACLLTANPALRRELLVLYMQRGMSHGSRSMADILWRFLHSDFEGLGGRLWIVVFVEILLEMGAINMTAASSSEGGIRQCTTRQVPPSRVVDSSSLSEVDPDVIAAYQEFGAALDSEISDVSINGGLRLRDALIILAHGDSNICQCLFQALLPAAWTTVSDDTAKLALVPAFEAFLSRPFYSPSFKTQEGCTRMLPANGVKAFLSSIVLLEPLPAMNADLLVYLAENYNGWFEVLYVLENQYFVLSSSELTDSGTIECDKLLLAMRRCYRELGETNICTSLALKSCNVGGSHRAASLDIYGRVDQALEAYSNLMELVESEEVSTNSFEMDFWEKQWVKLQREECQLDVVSEFASQTKNAQLMVECAWKECHWDTVRTLCATPPIISAVESGDPAMKMCETLSAVAEGKLSDVGNLHAQSSQLCLFKWRLLPSLSSGSLAHARLLHYFHRLVEISESGQIMVETNNHSNGPTLPDLKNLLNAWRHRLPNDEEDLTMWDEIFFWRAHMFNAIATNFHWAEPAALATLHDKPWTAIRMATVARKQGTRNTALLLLNRLADNQSMDVTDAYLKLREQILLYNNPDSERERTGGLNLINTTNLAYFDDAQKSELFRLKAIFLASLRRTSKSNQAYCHSVQICPTHSKSWISWGGLCSSLGAMTEKQAEQAKASVTSEEVAKSEKEKTKRVAQYLAQAMGCFLEAVQVNPTQKTRIHLPKCLWMLTKDGPAPGVLCQTLEGRAIGLPPFVWLPWIPQLLSGLCRSEGRTIRNLLSRVVKAYPQAVYYSLRAFYLERRDVERAKGGGSGGGTGGGASQGQQQHMGSVAYAEEMMSTLRRSHASLWSSLEAILEELIVRFRPSYEEELLATISALLERAESHAEKQSLPDEKRTEDEEAMVASWSKTLSRIAAKFFRHQNDSSSSSSRRDERRMKTAEFKRKYKEDFEGDFQVGGDGAQSEGGESVKPQFRLAQYIAKLTQWKEKLEAQVSRSPTRLPLISSSRALGMFVGNQPDLWPGACDTRHSNAGERPSTQEDLNARNQASASSSAGIARKAALNAALAAASAAAKEGIGGEMGGGSSAIEIPGQYVPNTSGSDLKPSPELHAKLVKFEPFVQVLRRSDQLVRRCGMIGSDGRTYRYLLQFAIPYWTRTDERTAQVYYILDQFLRENMVAARNHLSVQPTAAIPVAQRLRMCRDVDSRLALDDVLRRCFDAEGKDTKRVTAYFLEQITSKLKDKVPADASEVEKSKAEQEIRLEVYRDVCNTMVDKRLLVRYLQNAFNNQEAFYLFRRSFSVQMAANSLLQYAFSVAERTPQRFVIQQSNGKVMSPDFRVSYSNQGFIEGHAVPYRLTPNIETVLGDCYLQGEFIRAMAMIAGSVKDHRDEFDPILRLLMRDDILAWYSKSMAKTDSKTQELERQLIERVAKNVYTIQSRFAECSPSNKSGDTKPLDHRTNLLLQSAMDPEKLCMMPASYHPWL